MVEKNPNLLLGNAVAPQAGINYATAKAWYGGDLQVTATGTFDTATFQLMFCTRIPKLTGAQTYGDVLTDADWVPLATLTEPGMYKDTLNPCLLAIKPVTPGVNTRVRIILS